MLVPDMCTDATGPCEGPNGLQMGQKVSLVIESDSGIKNPSEAGTHSAFYDVLGPAQTAPTSTNVRARNKALRDADIAADIKPGGAGGMEMVVKTVAKIGLSDVDNKRGYEMTVTGSGFNNGTTAGVYVLANARFAVAKWWNTLDCAKMKMYMGSDSNRVLLQLHLDESAMSYTVGSDADHADFDALSADDHEEVLRHGVLQPPVPHHPMTAPRSAARWSAATTRSR